MLITESGSLVRGLRTPTGEAAFERGEGGAKTMAHATESGSGETNSGGGDAGRALEGSGASGCFSPDEFLEMDVNVRQWSFLARKGLHKLEPKFGLMNISVGFLIEGRQDDEVSVFLFDTLDAFFFCTRVRPCKCVCVSVRLFR